MDNLKKDISLWLSGVACKKNGELVNRLLLIVGSHHMCSLDYYLQQYRVGLGYAYKGGRSLCLLESTRCLKSTIHIPPP